uniref:Uncharacterized protein n=1 Tax=Ailuropoda melanoleuca TaxID=9646 RepID=A0A7N5KJU0_AILME
MCLPILVYKIYTFTLLPYSHISLLFLTRDASPSCLIISIPGSWFGKRLPPLRAGVLTCSGPMEDSPDVGTEVTEVMLICPVIWFMLLIPPVLVAMDTLMFILLLYMLVFACCPKCGGDCCENMLEHKEKITMSTEAW